MTRKKSMRKTRAYSPQERSEAIQRSEEVGPAQAGRELDIPSGTLSCWAFKARKGQKEPVVSTLAETETAPAGAEVARVARRYTPSERAEVMDASSEHARARSVSASRGSSLGVSEE